MKNDLSSSSSIDELIQIVEKLRDPQTGCPWDIKQSHKSLIPYVLEEAHEVVDAIRRRNNENNLCEELGDLLLQIILHAQIAKEADKFNLDDIVENICKKLVRRHPHVFLGKKISNSEELEKSWASIKNSEKNYGPSNHRFTGGLKEKIIPQPALFGSIYISKKAAEIGFEWNSIDEVWEKLDEEIRELKEELNQNDLIHAEEELGDVIFTLINIARWYKINPEEALSSTNRRFIERFTYIEEVLKGNLENQSIEKLQILWKEAKNFLKIK